MNGLSKAWGGRALAVSILIVLLGSIILIFVQSFIAVPRSRSAEIADLVEELAEAQSSAGRETHLRQRQGSMTAELELLGAFWPGISRSQIAAAMQDVLRSATQQGGGQIVSSSLREADAAGKTLGVRVRITGTLATLQTVLTTVEKSKPLLFADSLAVTISAASTPVQPQLLSFELGVMGYLPPRLRAKP